MHISLCPLGLRRLTSCRVHYLVLSSWELLFLDFCRDLVQLIMLGDSFPSFQPRCMTYILVVSDSYLIAYPRPTPTEQQISSAEYSLSAVRNDLVERRAAAVRNRDSSVRVVYLCALISLICLPVWWILVVSCQRNVPPQQWTFVTDPLSTYLH